VAVADDLTGANATAGALAALGFSSVTFPAPPRAWPLADLLPDAAAISTNSRNLPPTQAADLLKQVCSGIDLAAALVAKRIDTTLRGNLAPETLALLRAVRRQRPSQRVAALVVAAHPAAGRTTRQGVQLLDGVPVSQTPAGADPLRPVTESRISRLFETTGRAAVTEVHLDQVRTGLPALATALAAAAQASDIVVVDAAADDDLANIAQAAVLAGQSPVSAPQAGSIPTGRPPALSWLAVDPGPFTAELAALALTPAAPPAGRVLVLAGSTSGQTQSQLDLLRTKRHAAIDYLDLSALPEMTPAAAAPRADSHLPDGLGDVGQRPAASSGGDTELHTEGRLTPSEAAQCCHAKSDHLVAAAVQRLARAAGGGAAILGLQATPPAGPPNATTAQATAQLLGRLATAAMAAVKPSGLYLTGGDTAAAVLQALGATGLRVHRQVLPLAMLGTLVGGPHDGLPVVTKGGLVGPATAALACVAALSQPPSLAAPPAAPAAPAATTATLAPADGPQLPLQPLLERRH
jgi:uncharacterized protein YgbK (DUF1537 family)